MITPVLPRGGRTFLAALAIVAATLAGCGKTVEPLAPAASRVPASGTLAHQAVDEGLAQASPPANLFYPLELGNHWSYEHALRVVFVPDSGPPGPELGLRDTRVRDLVCIEHRAGRSYVVEQTSFPPTRMLTWVRYRQDEAGLYEADVGTTLPPECSGVSGRRLFDAKAAAAREGEAAWAAVSAKLADPAKQVAYRAAWERVQARASAIARVLGVGPGSLGGGVESGEIMRLQYPLHPGAHWVIRADPRFESTVEEAEALDLAAGRLPAWRIRLGAELLGPADHVHFWYGRSGFLKLVAHLEGVATDPDGNPIGRVIAEESEELVDLSLDRGRFGAP